MNEREELVAELEASLGTGNAYRVREICRRDPTLMRNIDLRVRIWSLLLLGRTASGSGSQSQEDEFVPNVPCREFQVLLNDVPRTRAKMFGKDDKAKDAMQYYLHKFCTRHNIEYKQGLNEVVAPFVWMFPPTDSQKYNRLGYDLFEAFVIRFIERFYCTDSSFFLMKSFRLFHLLMLYHDPQLALYLHEHDFCPELYTPQFFLCLYAREVEMELVMLIWDLFIVYDDPALSFFIGMCMMMEQRQGILLTDMNGIPDILQANRKLRTDTGIVSILARAHSLYKVTPRSFIRHLRLCCVGSNEMTPTYDAISQRRLQSGDDGESNIRLGDLDRRMVLQTARPAMFMSAHELISIVDPVQQSSSGSGGGKNDDGMVVSGQVVLIDLRSAEDGSANGAGLIPRAIQLEPNFLDFPEAFRAWLQHFDGTRGVNICIIDMPPTQHSGVKLWRRLLLGEGDGVVDQNASKAGGGGGGGEVVPNLPGSGKYSGGGSSGAPPGGGSPSSGAGGGMTLENQEEAILQAVVKTDQERPALRLAAVLQRETFAYVSVLEGGFPALVTQLKKQRGRVEPIVIQHYAEEWDAYMEESGRDGGGGGDLEGDMATAKNRAAYSLGGSMQSHHHQQQPQGRQHRGGELGGSAPVMSSRAHKKASELSTEERLELAVKRARELGHLHAAKELEGRISVLAMQRQRVAQDEALDAMGIIDFT